MEEKEHEEPHDPGTTLHKNDGNPDLPADPEPGDPDDHQYAGDFHLQHGGYIFREPDRHECIGGRRRELFVDVHDPGTWIYARNGKRKLSIAGPRKQG